MDFLRKYGVVSSAFLLAGLLPIAKAITSIPTLLLFLLLLLFHYAEIKNLKKYAGVILFTGIFFLTDIVKIVLDGQFDAAAQKAISLDVLLMAFPVFIFLDPNPQKLKEWALSGLCLCVLIFEIVCLLHAGTLFLQDRNTEHFYHEALVGITDIHPTYLSMMLNFTLFIFYLFHKNNTSVFKSKIVFAGVSLFQVLFILLLNSRLGLLLAIAGSGYMFFDSFRNVSKKGWIILIGSILLLVGNIVYFTPENAVKHRYRSISSLNMDTLRYYEPRVNIYDAGVHTILESPITGHPLGHNVDVLVTSYQKIGFQWGVEARFNAHNQYLEYGLEWGIPGLLLFVGLLIFGFYTAIKYREPLYFFFIVLISIYSATESIFKTQTGITFYAFFNSLFLAYIYRTKIKSPAKID